MSCRQRAGIVGRALKFVGILFGIVILLVVGAIVYVTTVIDPNDYKDQIAEAVGEATGRQLSLDGDLELNFFPSLRIAIGPGKRQVAFGVGETSFKAIAFSPKDIFVPYYLQYVGIHHFIERNKKFYM